MAFNLRVEDNKVIRTDTKKVVGVGACFNYNGKLDFIKRSDGNYYLWKQIGNFGLRGKVTTCGGNKDIDASTWKPGDEIDYDGIAEIHNYEGNYYLGREVIDYTEPTPEKKSWWKF
tara:strand:+ start:598 stop:945 length:348 start_codon:yes stop_codon:yes gene_type:complete